MNAERATAGRATERMLLGVDTGGTFTDFVLFDGKRVRFHKELSTPHDPCEAILAGIGRLGLDAGALHLVHGSTVATNAILERKGVRTLFVTNRGIEDLLRIGRQTRERLYDLTPPVPEPWLTPEDCLGIGGRVDAEGRLIAPVPEDDLVRLRERAKAYEAVAVCTLFSFLNPWQEQAARAALPEGVFVSVSHEVLAEYREFERAATTFLNAYTGPLVARYLERLDRALGGQRGRLFVMHSAGGVMEAREAAGNAARMVLSGPAGGLVAARAVGEQLGAERLMTFDMGGTSTDVALLDGAPRITTEARVAGMPVAVPMLDIHTIGAGGGSIAWVDEAGLLQVGPESAGASPGPACYGLGGERPTVTDANVVLGRMPRDIRLAGGMPVDAHRAEAALARLGARLGLDARETALGVVRVAEEKMAGALRAVSVQRGYDPRRFALVCFGGAGGLHACALAERLGMTRVVLPVASGAFSALGMLAGKRQADVSRTRRIPLADPGAMDAARGVLAGLREQAERRMPGLALEPRAFADMRYAGQGFHLTIPWADDAGALAASFAEAHEAAYGHGLDAPVEIITLRLTAVADTPCVRLPELPRASGAPEPAGHAMTEAGRAPCYRREILRPGHDLAGPALVLEDTATLWLPTGWRLEVSPHGHLLLSMEGLNMEERQ